MPVLNEQTGETVVGETGVHIIFTVEAWLWMERRLGRGMLRLLQQAADMDFGIVEVSTMLLCGAEAWRRRNSPNSEAWTEGRALDVITEVGGLLPALKDVADAIKFSPALGAGIASNGSAGPGEGPAEDPFVSGNSSPGPSALVSVPGP